MKLSKKFNQFSFDEYINALVDHKAFTDFNTLGLYRSLSENENLTLEEKIAIRDYAHHFFRKRFDFLQLKDPQTYFKVSTLGQELLPVEENQFWQRLRANQQKILAEKQLDHRNFGVYAKHDCGYEDCPLNGVMVKKGWSIVQSHMWFKSDKNPISGKQKAERNKKERKNAYRDIRRRLDEE